MLKKFVVRLSAEERNRLESVISRGQGAARRLTRARILLKADSSEDGPHWSDKRIAEALDVGLATIQRVRRLYAEKGFDAVLARRSMPRRPGILDGDQMSRLLGLARSQPPDGVSRWTLRLLAAKLVELGHVETVSHETIRRKLREVNLSAGRVAGHVSTCRG
jgi:transposase